MDNCKPKYYYIRHSHKHAMNLCEIVLLCISLTLHIINLYMLYIFGRTCIFHEPYTSSFFDEALVKGTTLTQTHDEF